MPHYINTGAGKGSKPRPVNKRVFDANYERIFGKGKFNSETVSTPEKKSCSNCGHKIENSNLCGCTYWNDGILRFSNSVCAHWKEK